MINGYIKSQDPQESDPHLPHGSVDNLRCFSLLLRSTTAKGAIDHSRRDLIIPLAVFHFPRMQPSKLRVSSFIPVMCFPVHTELRSDRADRLIPVSARVRIGAEIGRVCTKYWVRGLSHRIHIISKPILFWHILAQGSVCLLESETLSCCLLDNALR